jgi:hypothetical protein
LLRDYPITNVGGGNTATTKVSDILGTSNTLQFNLPYPFVPEGQLNVLTPFPAARNS